MKRTPKRSIPIEDPLKLLPRALTKLHSVWLKLTYPFASIGTDVSIHYTTTLWRVTARSIKLGSSIIIAKDAWLNIIRPETDTDEPIITIEDGCGICPRCQVSAKNSIHLERDVLVSASVLMMDHSHAYADATVPIRAQGTSKGGTIRIGRGCWIGHGAAIISTQGDLVLGRNCIVGANSVVTRSFPPYSVLTGNPARIVKQFDEASQTWVLGSARPIENEAVARQASNELRKSNTTTAPSQPADSCGASVVVP